MGGDAIQITAEAYQRLMQLLGEFQGDIGALERAVAAGRRGKASDLRVDRISAADVLALFNASVITKAEARKFLGKSGAGPEAPRPRSRASR